MRQEAYERCCQALFAQGAIYDEPLTLIKADGTRLHALLSAVLEYDENGQPRRSFSVLNDITQWRLAQSRLHQLTYYHPVTELPNQSLLAQWLEEAQNGQQQTHLLLVDLDRYKTLAGHLGQSQAQELLRQFAQRLQRLVGVKGRLAHLTSDDFVILSYGPDANSVKELSIQIGQMKHQTYAFGGQELTLTCSLGWATCPEHGNNLETLLQHAHQATDHARRSGGDQMCRFSWDMENQAREKLLLESHLRQALRQPDTAFELWFQPQVRLEDGQIEGVEALIRWSTAEGFVSPGRFIPLAEELGLITELDQWVIQQACSYLAHWRREGYSHLRLGINLSARQFEDPALPQMLRQTLDRHEVPAHYLELEVTESMLIGDMDQAIGILQELKGLGVKLALDDFGTGYSSLNYLQQFPFDRLKIDRSFIRNVLREGEAQTIAHAILTLGQSLGLETIAEGIELEEQRHYLASHGCHSMQGFLYSPPVREKDLLTML